MSNNTLISINEFKYSSIETSESATENKINSFSTFIDGWHFGEGEVFDSEIIELALGVLYLLNSNYLYQTDAFPGFNGEIRVTGYEENKYYEITINKDKTIDYTFELEDKTLISKNALLFKDLDMLIDASKSQYSWNAIYESSHPIILIKPKRNSTALRLKIHPRKRVGAFPLSNVHAQLKNRKIRALTYQKNIKTLDSSHMFIGNSMKTFFCQVQ